MKKKLKSKLSMAVHNLMTGRILYFALVLLALASCKDKDPAHEHDAYTCPMHPTVISDRPGTCPVCGMDLVRKARPGEEVKITEDLKPLIQSPNEVVIASIETKKAEFKAMDFTVSASGVVTYDTRNIYTIPARVGGRLEKTTLKYPFQPVRKGQKVAEIYSPELVTAQREFLYLLEKEQPNSTLIQSAKARLKYSGLSDAQIDALIARKEVNVITEVYSAHDGYLIPPDQEPPTSTATRAAAGTGMTDAMGGGTQPANRAQPSPSAMSNIIREGTYVSAGTTLFKIVNINGIRIELDVSASEGIIIKKGNEIDLDFGDGERIKAKVDFVQPYYSQGEEFLKLRVYARKADLHIGHLVEAKLSLRTPETLWVPKGSVVDLGVQKVVFVKNRGVFKPQPVTTGVRTGALIEIKRGLSTSEEIAVNGQYIVDSESFIKTN